MLFYRICYTRSHNYEFISYIHITCHIRNVILQNFIQPQDDLNLEQGVPKDKRLCVSCHL